MTSTPAAPPAASRPADLLVVGADLVTMAPGREVVTASTVAIADGRIAAIGPAAALRAAYPGTPELDATGCVVVPGLVNAHQHTTADPLVRSTIPDDVPAQRAIFDWIVPLHAAVDGDDDELSATLTAVEALSHGVTTLLEPGTVAHPTRVARGLRTAGIRARVGCWGWDTPGAPYALPAADALAAQADTVAALAGDALVTGWITLVGHDLASDELFTGAAELAQRLDVPMTWHLSPGPEDAVAYAAAGRARPVLHLRELGVLGPRLLLGHAVWLDDAEVTALVESGTAVASCPGAYLRLGQGFSRAGRHTELRRAGGRLALGTDSHNAGDTPDVWRAARLFAGLERDRGVADPLRADEVFALATVDGAAAVGLGDTIGSIEVGKAADLVVLDTRTIAWIPRGDLPTQLVWGAVGHSVRDVLVDGRVVLRDRRITTVDVDALREEAADRRAALLRRSGIDISPRWPTVPATDYRACRPPSASTPPLM
ncbi:amidohydrolase family protein [Micromonospora endophytica]|uniref:Amidohydrolase n=1 Tax=Micromonospora endophytica TaxID=515350 RepID=A0A2W2DR05_9ACTN|nr:amidohydrolase family protein [Micromonospora endophytica]PZF99616.1 amidohydrolase [Micromonospora endophytica]RIW43850.1 amidohydrolase [Micromonospora endophytica]BCJ56980.1 S-adenosylhomocysteine deaminase [Micromonospora endophytica]